MNIDEIRRSLTTLKIHVDTLDTWVMQVSNTIYDIEEKLMDAEDKDYSKKYLERNTIGFFEGAATKLYDYNDRPPRLSSHCEKYSSYPQGFYQSEFDLKKIV
jgi:hypothetical protein